MTPEDRTIITYKASNVCSEGRIGVTLFACGLGRRACCTVSNKTSLAAAASQAWGCSAVIDPKPWRSEEPLEPAQAFGFKAEAEGKPDRSLAHSHLSILQFTAVFPAKEIPQNNPRKVYVLLSDNKTPCQKNKLLQDSQAISHDTGRQHFTLIYQHQFTINLLI